MTIKVKTKPDKSAKPLPMITNHYQSLPTITIPSITPPKVRTQNIIIRALKIMLMDIRMIIHPKQTKEELEKYSQFADLVYGRK